jgi:hypothetical protein
VNTLAQDLRFALRLFTKSPGFTLVVALSLALGIGASTTAFGWIESVLRNPLQGVQHGERLVSIETVTPSGETIDSSYYDFRDYRDKARSLDGAVAFKDRPLSLGDEKSSQRVGSNGHRRLFSIPGPAPRRGAILLGGRTGRQTERASGGGV